MDDTQLIHLRATAHAILGFVPEWHPDLCADILKRCKELGVIPAVYLQAVVEHLRIPAFRMQLRSVVLSPKWGEFVQDQLKLMQEQAKIRCESDLVEFRSALVVCSGDYKEVLEDRNFDISCFGRNWISKMYALEDVAETLELEATAEVFANPFLKDAYDNIKEDD